MDTNKPQLPAISRGSVQPPDPFAERQEDVDRRIRSDILDAMTMPVGKLQSYDEDALADEPAYKAVWIRTLQQATKEKPDMRAVEFVQEHVMGKAVQRVVSTKQVLTYQDVLHKAAIAEEAYQAAVKEVEQPLDVEEALDWASLV